MKVKGFTCKSNKLKSDNQPKPIELSRYQKACANLKPIQKSKQPSTSRKAVQLLEQKFVSSNLQYIL